MATKGGPKWNQIARVIALLILLLLVLAGFKFEIADPQFWGGIGEATGELLGEMAGLVSMSIA